MVIQETSSMYLLPMIMGQKEGFHMIEAHITPTLPLYPEHSPLWTVWNTHTPVYASFKQTIATT